MTEQQEAEARCGSLHNDYPYGEFKEAVDKMELGAAQGTIEGRQMGHGDRGWQFPEGHKPGQGAPHTIQTIWVLDSFTEERGATRLLPDSHKWGIIPNSGPGRFVTPICDPI